MSLIWVEAFGVLAGLFSEHRTGVASFFVAFPIKIAVDRGLDVLMGGWDFVGLIYVNSRNRKNN